jgi:aspartate kinase
MKVGVLKFGGTSVANGECIRHVAGLIARQRESQELFPVVVVSAMAGVTDLLIELAGEAALGRSSDRGLAQLRQRHVLAAEESVQASVWHPSLLAELGRAFQFLERDLAQVARAGEWGVASVCSWGERLSVLLLTASVRALGASVEAVREAAIVTEDTPHFLAGVGAQPLPSETGQRVRETITPLFRQGIVPIVPGFIARTPAGRATLLGRGGSDWTATLVGAALQECAAVSIYTDVCGIHSADPRVVAEAQLLPQLSYSEAAYLAWFGAKILHPQTLNPVMRRGIPVYVKSTFDPESPGTVIGPHQTLGREMGALALRRHLALVSVRSGYLLGSAEHQAPGAGMLARAGIIPFAVCASPGNQLSFVVDESLADSLVALMQDEGGDLHIACRRNLAACTYVGAELLGDLIRPGCALTSLAAEDIAVEAISITQFGLTLIVREDDAERTLRDLHTALLPTQELVPA